MNRNGNKAESVGGNFVASDDWRLFFEVPNVALRNTNKTRFIEGLAPPLGVHPATTRYSFAIHHS